VEIFAVLHGLGTLNFRALVPVVTEALRVRHVIIGGRKMLMQSFVKIGR
jgi:hypothetical protein